MARTPGIRRFPVASSSTHPPRMLGTVLLGLAALSSGSLQTLAQASSTDTVVIVYANPNYAVTASTTRPGVSSSKPRSRQPVQPSAPASHSTSRMTA